MIQKTFTVDFLSKKVKKNEGEIPQYYVTGNHPAITDPEVWGQTQAELNRRKGKYISSTSVFSWRVKCGQCGAPYGAKTWHPNSKYERKVWRCKDKYKNGIKCTTPVVETAQIEAAFVEALSRRITGHAGARRALQVLEATVFNTDRLEANREQQTREVEIITTAINDLVTQAVSSAMDVDEYDRKYSCLEQTHQTAVKKLEATEVKIEDRRERLAQSRAVLEYLETQPPLEYSDEAWVILVDHATVHHDGHITVCFKDEVESGVGSVC